MSKNNTLEQYQDDSHMEQSTKKYLFGTRSIYWEMGAYFIGKTPSTMYPELYIGEDFNSYYNASIEDRINMVNENLKKFLFSKILHNTLYIPDLKSKTLEELMEILDANTQDKEEVWVIVHYLLGIIAEINGPTFVMCADRNDESLIGNPKIDYDKKQIDFHISMAPLEMYKFINEKLFNVEYLSQGEGAQSSYSKKRPVKHDDQTN